MTQIQQLYASILQWSSDRNLTKGATQAAQTLKLSSEVGELADAVLKNDIAGRVDGIGDAFVVMAILSAQANIALHEYLPAMIVGTYAVGGQEQSRFLDLYRNTGELAQSVFDDHLNALPLYRSLEALKRLADSMALDFVHCIQSAYDEIKDRKGVMHNGAFIKSTDPLYEGILAEIAAKQ